MTQKELHSKLFAEFDIKSLKKAFELLRKDELIDCVKEGKEQKYKFDKEGKTKKDTQRQKIANTIIKRLENENNIREDLLIE